MTKTNLLTKTLLASALISVTSGASAAAFQLAEVSTSGLGRAYAGEAAIADNAAVVATNPALMTQFKRPEFSIGGVYVDSKIRLNGDVQLTGSTPLAAGTIAMANQFGSTSGSANVNSVVPGAFVPNLYYIHPIDDRFAVGGGMNVNFGMKSEFDADYNAGLFGGTTDLTALNLNLSGAYKISEGWSIGLGLNAVYAKAKVERTAGVVSPLLNLQRAAAGLAPNLNSSSVITHLEDDAWGFGWNAGVTYNFNENNRVGLAYHSHINIDFKDNSAVSPRNPLGATGELTLNLPAYWEFSGYHKMTDKFAMHYSYKYTTWNRFKELCGTYVSSGQTCDALYKKEEFKNNQRLALGATYDVNDALTVRAGIAYDETAAGQHKSASIPDTDRTWYSVGLTYKFTPNFSADFGYTHIRGSKTQFVETETLANGVVLQADYSSKSSANLYGLNLNYRF
ncbi:outer membrane protein transport protein [Conservatibacter flavescens]|uniref:Long-chain fatty acid outer membrane transporter n=1 Tax=Conservatibacter flavescens TaxID=28161 RepID=A0A2M8S1W2_9PAST|nr:outer membrane protein transport protein [Conservatibacter flavescens]PJG85098.1 hypothetical protein CVP05_07520 [Conservatibacter flavescens]